MGKQTRVNENLTIGQQLRELRQAAGLTRKEFADEIGTSESVIASWENDTRLPSSGDLKKVARVMGCSEERRSASSRPLSTA